MRGPAEDLLIFTDDEFAWVESPVERPVERPQPPEPAPPARSRRRPRQRRTLARDLAALGTALTRWASAVPLTILLILVSALLAGIVAIALRGGDGPSVAEHADRGGGGAAEEVAPVASPVTETTLEPGDTGEVVRGVQAALNLLGFGPEVSDGVYAESTSAAVAAFQRTNALTPDGVVGPLTAAALANELGEQARSEATTAGQGLTRLLPRGAFRHRRLSATSRCSLRLSTNSAGYPQRARFTSPWCCAMSPFTRRLTTSRWR